MAKFKIGTLEKIKSDPDLFSLVCKEMDVKPTSLPAILHRNGNNLNQFSIVALVANYLNVEPETLVEGLEAVQI